MENKFVMNVFFITACGSGNLEEVGRIWNKGGVDIHALNECAFLWSCSLGQIHIVEWLWNKGIEIGSPIDIHVEDNFVFQRKNKCVLYLFKKGLYPNKEISTDLYYLWKSSLHSVQIVRKSSFIVPFLNEIILSLIK